MGGGGGISCKEADNSRDGGGNSESTNTSWSVVGEESRWNTSESVDSCEDVRDFDLGGTGGELFFFSVLLSTRSLAPLFEEELVNNLVPSEGTGGGGGGGGGGAGGCARSVGGVGGGGGGDELRVLLDRLVELLFFRLKSPLCSSSLLLVSSRVSDDISSCFLEKDLRGTGGGSSTRWCCATT